MFLETGHLKNLFYFKKMCHFKNTRVSMRTILLFIPDKPVFRGDSFRSNVRTATWLAVTSVHHNTTWCNFLNRQPRLFHYSRFQIKVYKCIYAPPAFISIKYWTNTISAFTGTGCTSLRHKHGRSEIFMRSRNAPWLIKQFAVLP